ncbi:MAG: ATP-binding protein [Pseudomonadota bacterium]
MRYMAASRRWLADYGLPARDIIGEELYALSPHMPESWKVAQARCLAGEELSADEDSFIAADGSVQWLHWELQPWRTIDGAVGGVMMFSENITARVAAEQALARHRDVLEAQVAERTAAAEAAKNEALRATELKSRFLSAASHDLRQPTHAAQLFLDALRSRLEAPEQVEICGKTQQALETLSGILDTFLDASRLERGVVHPRISEFALDDMMARIIAHNRPRAEAKGLRFVHEVCGCTIRSDQALLERVVDNFVSNAVRYTEKGEVTLRCVKQDAGFMRISVSDTGPGIPEDARERIFEEYVQLPNAIGRQGSGLGLFIAQQVASLLGAPITLTTAAGQGSTFAIDVPAAQGGCGPSTA